jgi:hypothetical protein
VVAVAAGVGEPVHSQHLVLRNLVGQGLPLPPEAVVVVEPVSLQDLAVPVAEHQLLVAITEQILPVVVVVLVRPTIQESTKQLVDQVVLVAGKELMVQQAQPALPFLLLKL